MGPDRELAAISMTATELSGLPGLLTSNVSREGASVGVSSRPREPCR